MALDYMVCTETSLMLKKTGHQQNRSGSMRFQRGNAKIRLMSVGFVTFGAECGRQFYIAFAVIILGLISVSNKDLFDYL